MTKLLLITTVVLGIVVLATVGFIAVQERTRNELVVVKLSHDGLRSAAKPPGSSFLGTGNTRS
jgi:hypothetical protein